MEYGICIKRNIAYFIRKRLLIVLMFFTFSQTTILLYKDTHTLLVHYNDTGNLVGIQTTTTCNYRCSELLLDICTYICSCACTHTCMNVYTSYTFRQFIYLAHTHIYTHPHTYNIICMLVCMFLLYISPQVRCALVDYHKIILP